MKDLLSKRFADIGKEDVERLIDHQEEEGPLLELKGPLPGQDIEFEPWQQGINKILPSVRNAVLKEVAGMATANSGGIVLLGVDETDDEPKRAKAPFPLRDCVELASRFEARAWSCIDPRIPNLEVKGIPLQPDGAGVVLFRVSRSIFGPYSLNTTQHAYIRRGSSTEIMEVREIQLHTLQTRQGLDWTEDRFADRRQKFDDWKWAQPDSNETTYIRATTIPIGPVVSVDAPYAYDELWPAPRRFKGSIDGRDVMLGMAQLWNTTKQPRPILRGAFKEYVGHDRTPILRQEIHWDGLVDIWTRRPQDNQNSLFYQEEILAAVIESFRLADLARRHGGAPGVDLAVEVELQIRPFERTSSLARIPGVTKDCDIDVHSLVLPRATASGEDFGRPLQYLLNDLLNHGGQPGVGEFSLDPINP